MPLFKSLAMCTKNQKFKYKNCFFFKVIVINITLLTSQSSEHRLKSVAPDWGAHLNVRSTDLEENHVTATYLDDLSACIPK